MHRAPSQSVVTLRSSLVATLIVLLFFYLMGGQAGAPGELPEPVSPAPGAAPSSPDAAPGSAQQRASGQRPAAGGGDTAASGAERAPVPQSAKPLANRTIVLDPGHGGSDPGALGVSGKTREAYNTLFVALDAKNLLEQAGARVILTRSDDRYVPLAARAAIANQAGADVFISIHNDSNPNPAVHGVTTYYYHERSRRLADVMQAHLAQALGTRSVGVIRRSFHVVRETTMPAVLLELGFLSNWSEERLLADPAYRYRAALAIYNGVVDYFAQSG